MSSISGASLLILLLNCIALSSQNCISLKGSTACPSFGIYSIELGNNILQNQYSTLDAVDTLLNGNSQIEDIVPVCSKWSDDKHQVRYAKTIRCVALVTSSPGCNTGLPSVTICQDSCLAFVDSYQSVGKEECPNNSTGVDSQAASWKSYCQSTPTTGCIEGDQNESQGCGFITVAEQCAYCNTNGGDSCCKNLQSGECSAAANNPNMLTVTTTASNNSNGSATGSGTNKWVIIGVSVGCSFLVLFAIFLFFFYRSVKKTLGSPVPSSTYQKETYFSPLMTPPPLTKLPDKSPMLLNSMAIPSPNLGFKKSSPLTTPSPTASPSHFGNDNKNFSGTTRGIDSVTMNGGKNEFLVIVAFEPHLEDEIGIQPGDIMIVQQVFDDGWAVGENTKTGEKGIFPLPCCVQANESYDSATMTNVDVNRIVGRRDSSYTYSYSTYNR